MNSHVNAQFQGSLPQRRWFCCPVTVEKSTFLLWSLHSCTWDPPQSLNNDSAVLLLNLLHWISKETKQIVRKFSPRKKILRDRPISLREDTFFSFTTPVCPLSNFRHPKILANTGSQLCVITTRRAACWHGGSHYEPSFSPPRWPPPSRCAGQRPGSGPGELGSNPESPLTRGDPCVCFLSHRVGLGRLCITTQQSLVSLETLHIWQNLNQLYLWGDWLLGRERQDGKHCFGVWSHVTNSFVMIHNTAALPDSFSRSDIWHRDGLEAISLVLCPSSSMESIPNYLNSW